MMEFTSLFDDAGASAEAEAADRALANAKVATAGLWPFLALAQDEAEFSQRLAIAEDRITAAAVAAGASPTALAETYQREFALLMEARKSATTYSGYAGDPEPDERTAHERYGDTKWDDFYGRDPGDEADDFYERGEDGRSGYYASIKQALEEGQDPLAWLEAEDNIGGATPEKPGGHIEGPDFSGGYSEVPAGGQATGGRRPFEAGWGRSKAAPAVEADPLEGRAQCPCGSKMTAPFGDNSGQSKCYSCDGVFTPGQKAAAKTAGGARRLYSEHPSGYRAEWRGGPRYHIYEGDTPVDSPAIPGYSDAMTSSQFEQHADKFTQKKLDRHFNKWVDENGAGYSSFNHPEDEPMSYADRQRFKELDRRGSRRTASGMGMPEGGMLSGADIAGSVSDPNVPQQAQPFPGAGPAPSEQSTTKPRQMPGGSDSTGGDPSAPNFDPALNGSDGGAGAPNQAPPPGNSAEAKRATATRIVQVMRTIREDNPGMSKSAAYAMASKVVREYGLVSEAAPLNAIDFGNRPDVEDGPWTKRIKNMQPSMPGAPKVPEGPHGPSGEVPEEKGIGSTYHNENTIPGEVLGDEAPAAAGAGIAEELPLLLV